MGLKFDVKTSVDANKLDVKTCKQVIASLEDAYKRTRGEIYALFLGRRSLTLAITLSLLCLLFYAMSSTVLFVYAALISFLLIMVLAIIAAEITTKAIHRQFKEKIRDLNKMLEMLKRKQEFNN